MPDALAMLSGEQQVNQQRVEVVGDAGDRDGAPRLLFGVVLVGLAGCVSGWWLVLVLVWWLVASWVGSGGGAR